MSKVLIISEFAPPAVNGPSVILGNIFRFFPGGGYSIFTTDQSRTSSAYDPQTRLDCEYHLLEYPRWLRRMPRSQIIGRFCWFALAALWIIRQGLKVVEEAQADAIFAPNGQGPFFIAAYYIHRLSGCPLYVYLLDLYREGHTDPVDRWFAQRYEERILRSAAKVWGMSEPLCEQYQQDYDIQVELAPHPVVLSDKEENEFRPIDPTDIEIVYTGNLYHAQLDSVINLARVVDSMDNLRLTLYISRSPEYVKQLKTTVRGRGISWSYVDRDGIAEVQRNADILFLPIAFESSYSRDYLCCASPSKMPEYLAAGRPIIVHAPDFAYVVWYARKNGFGLVVDKPDTECLRQAVLRLVRDENLQLTLVKNASRTVKAHDAESLSVVLQETLLKSSRDVQ